jgi:DNA-binding HxlR family transcriptional regulator
MPCESHDVPSLQKLFSRIGSKWSLLILIFLAQNPPSIRFTALQREISGVSQKMLSHTLKSLERDGLVRRELHAEIPPRVEYSITDLGMSLLPVAQGFADWALENGELIERKRGEFDQLVA